MSGYVSVQLLVLLVFAAVVTAASYRGEYRVKFISYKNLNGSIINSSYVCQDSCSVSFIAEFSHAKGKKKVYEDSKYYKTTVMEFVDAEPFKGAPISVQIFSWQGFMKYNVTINAKIFHKSRSRTYLMMDNFYGEVRISHLQRWIEFKKCRSGHSNACLKFAIMVLDYNSSQGIGLAGNRGIPTALIVVLIIIPLLLIAGLLTFFIGRRRGLFQSCDPPCGQKPPAEESAYSVVDIKFTNREDIQSQSQAQDDPSQHQYAKVNRKSQKTSKSSDEEVEPLNQHRPDIVAET